MGAILNGLLTDDGGLACDVRFQWGQTIALGNFTPWLLGDGTTYYRTGATFSQTITGLAGNTIYYFQAQARNAVGTSSGAILSFVTTHGDTILVTTLPPTLITDSRAYLHGILTDALGQVCETRFVWGSTTDYGNITAWRGGLTTGQTFDTAIGELSPDTAYHYAAEAQSNGLIYRGNDIIFTTLPLETVVFVGDEIFFMLH
jgi:hypothetical protein